MPALLCGLVALLLYLPATRNGFALDDTIDLIENRFVTGPLDLGGIFSSEYYGGWGHMASGHYRPLLNLTYKLVASLFGVKPAPFHLLNVLLFALLVALTVDLVRRVSGDRRVGVLAGLLFAVHPLNSESVAAIAGLKELAAAGLGMLACQLYLRARETVGFAPSGTRTVEAVSIFACLLAALLYKETALAFVPIAVGAEFLHAGAPRSTGARDALRRMLRGWPLLAAAAVALALRAAVTGGLFRPTVVDPVDNPLILLDEPFRRLAALGLLGRYLTRFVWPACLSSDYSEGTIPLPTSAGDPWIVGSALLAAALGAIAIRSARRGPRATAFGLVAFGATYVLVSNVVVVIGTNMAERLFFVPCWGLCIALAAGLVAARDRSLPRSTAASAGALAAVAVALLLPLAARTWIRTLDWRDTAFLADAVHRCHPTNVKVLISLAEREAARGRHDRARELYDRALAVRPDSAYAEAALGIYLLERGETERAETLLRSSAGKPGAVPGAVVRLALHDLDRRRNDDAFLAAQRALEVGPGFADAALARLVLGEVALRRGDIDEAEKQYRLAITENPREPAARFNLGRVLEARGRLEEALEALLAAEALAPSDARVLYARAVVEAKLRRFDRSLETIERVIAIDPTSAAAREHRERLRRVLGVEGKSPGR